MVLDRFTMITISKMLKILAAMQALKECFLDGKTKPFLMIRLWNVVRMRGL